MIRWEVVQVLSILEDAADSLGAGPDERRAIKKRLLEDEALVQRTIDRPRNMRGKQ